MLAWVVIDRQHLRQAAPFASLRSSPLFPLAHLSPLLPVAYALPLATAAPQPLCNQSVTHSFYLDGGCTPLWRCPTTAILSNAYPMFPISFIFNPVRILLHFFALPKNSTLLFSSDSALFAKNTRGGGVRVHLPSPQVITSKNSDALPAAMGAAAGRACRFQERISGRPVVLSTKSTSEQSLARWRRRGCLPEVPHSMPTRPA